MLWPRPDPTGRKTLRMHDDVCAQGQEYFPVAVYQGKLSEYSPLGMESDPNVLTI